MTPDEAIKHLNEHLPNRGWVIAKGRVGIEPLFAIQIYEKFDYMPWEEPVAIARTEGDDFGAMVRRAVNVALQPKE